MSGKAWKKREFRRAARRRGYRKAVRSWGGYVRGIVADME